MIFGFYPWQMVKHYRVLSKSVQNLNEALKIHSVTLLKMHPGQDTSAEVGCSFIRLLQYYNTARGGSTVA